MMKIGILETGEIHEDLEAVHGEYPKMFERLLNASNPDITFISVKVCAGDIPSSPHEADGWIITGSKFGVYEDHKWIPPLKTFLQACVEKHVPVAGICFGHQILAEALGGRVEKSDKGWGVGVHSYEFSAFPSWMRGAGKTFAGHAIHQDQVVELPPSATVIARSEFCNYAAIVYGDPENPTALSVQPHPEFETAFVKDIIDVRLKDTISSEIAKSAHETLSINVNNDDWGRWIADYFARSIERNG